MLTSSCLGSIPTSQQPRQPQEILMWPPQAALAFRQPQGSQLTVIVPGRRGWWLRHSSRKPSQSWPRSYAAGRASAFQV